jgi:adenylate cyclase
MNLSGNKKLEIKSGASNKGKFSNDNLIDFSTLTKIQCLGLMDVTVMVGVPEETHHKRIRTTASQVGNIRYGMSDYIPPSEDIRFWDLVIPEFRGKSDESVFGLFSGGTDSDSVKVCKYINDWFMYSFSKELERLQSDESISEALRRSFLSLNKEQGTTASNNKIGASALVIYMKGRKLYLASLGDCEAGLSRTGLEFKLCGPSSPLEEVQRIRDTGGYVSEDGQLNGELRIASAIGYYNMLPSVNADPFVMEMDLMKGDEFVIMGNKGLWSKISLQTAIDIARMDRDDPMRAAMKLRDFAVMYGYNGCISAMVFSVEDLFTKKKKNRYSRATLSRKQSMALARDVGTLRKSVFITNNKVRVEDEVTDSVRIM